MDYNKYERFSLDPQNEREVMEKAITRAYQASAGKINAFNAGSPLVVLLEALVFTQMEFLFWLNEMPEAMVLAYVGEILGAGRDYGSKAETTILLTLSQPLTSKFILNAGTTIYSKSNNEISYALESTLTIPAGQTTGFGIARAKSVGKEFQVAANELQVLAENYAYVLSITNPSASTTGSDFETLENMAIRVQALMSQTTPVSQLDWLNTIELYFPGKQAEVQNYDGILYLYIQDYIEDLPFQAYCQAVKGLLQTIEFRAYEKALLQIRIEPAVPFSQEVALAVSTTLSNYLLRSKPLQAIDLYEVAINSVNKTDFNAFDVLYYYSGLDPKKVKSILLQPFDLVGGQLVKDEITSYYSLVNTSFNIVASAFDEAELGYLTYHPVYTALGPGVYASGDIVKIGALYYLITSSGNFNPANTLNWTILSSPQTWDNGLTLTSVDWLIESASVPGLSHGFIPAFNYTTVDSIEANLTPLTPVAKIAGQSVAPGEYFYLIGLDEVVYYNNSFTNYTVNLGTLSTIAQPEIFAKPNKFYSSLTRRSKYSIGQISEDKNYIYITSSGLQSPIATGLSIPDYAQSTIPLYGTLIVEDDVIYEVLSSFIPLVSDTIQSLLTAGLIKKAYRKYSDFEVIGTEFSTPYYFDIEFVLFDQEQDIIVSKNSSGNYTVS